MRGTVPVQRTGPSRSIHPAQDPSPAPFAVFAAGIDVSEVAVSSRFLSTSSVRDGDRAPGRERAGVDHGRASVAAGLLARPRLLDVVGRRWSRTITAVVAGAGFGKTTLIEQAVAAERSTDTGLDIVVRVDAPDASALRLAGRMLAAMGVESQRLIEEGELLDHLVDELWARAPQPVCLVLDDLHEIPGDSDGMRLVRDLARRLPRNAHLLVGARRLPEIGIGRFAVAGDAEVLREEDLRFTDDEIEEFAAVRGVDPAQLRAAHGWPALAELFARARGVSAVEYVWEEVVGPIGGDDRARIVELAAVGRADDEMASAVAGRPVQLAALLAEVPLARRQGSVWELHEVIGAALLEREDADVVADVRRRAAAHAAATGDAERALRLLVAAGAQTEVVGVLRDQFVRLGSQEEPGLAERWVVLLDDDVLEEPEGRLAAAVAATVADPERAFALAEEAVGGFSDRGDLDGEIAGYALMGQLAYALVDGARMLPHVPRIMAVAEDGHRGAHALGAMCVGAYALLAGSYDDAVAALLPVVDDPLGDATEGSAAFLCARALVDGGRVQEAAALLARVPAADRARVRDGILGVEVAIAQGLGADVEVIEELRDIAEARVDRRPVVARRIARCRLAYALATTGDLDGARRQMAELDLLGPTVDATRDEELFASAVLAVASGDETEAARLLAQVPDRGAFFPPLEGLVTFYVLRPELRARYDARELRGVHAVRRAFAAAFVAARAGDPGALAEFPWPRAEVMRWFAPAAWLVEAVVRATAVGGRPPAALAEALAPSQREVIRRLAGDADATVAAAARQWDTALGPMAPCRLTICVLGALEVRMDGEETVAPQLRRERVRALLALLVVRRSVRRADAARALWPELDEEAALGNLRVTLTHLLKLLEPDRHRNAPSFFVRQERDLLVLHDDPALEVDAWEFEHAVERAARAEEMGSPSAVLAALVPAIQRWRGRPFEDVGAHEWLELERIRLGTLYIRAALRAGELFAADHELDQAEVQARRVIMADPWNEAGYRLLATAHLERGDRSGARRVLERLISLLDELDVSPEAATLALLGRTGG